ncbi:cyclin H [Cryptococcus gattii NT-10]|nr:cyclin H [Cryptococcus gattii NT-10]
MVLSGQATPSEAGPSKPSLTPGPSAYHESSQFRHWRFSPSTLDRIRSELNTKSVEVARRNTELEKEAQKSLGHDIADPPPAATYLTVNDELLLLRFYCSQVSRICREGFGLPEVVESTAISYVKRFYLKNSVMEWHPKIIMPTCLYLAAKTTNFPIPADQFVSKIPKLTSEDVLEKEFLVAQSLSFEFWVHGADKALRGWTLDMQDQPNPPLEAIQKAIAPAFTHLSTSYLSDAEFIFTPSQISLACLRMADNKLVEGFLEGRYAAHAAAIASNSVDGAEESKAGTPVQGPAPLYGMEKSRLLEILEQIEAIIQTAAVGLDVKKVKEVDKRLRQCTNPEKIPGTALYIKRKQEKEATEAAAKAAKTLKAQSSAADSDVFFGGSLPLSNAQSKSRVPLSPRVNLNGNQKAGGAEVEMSDTGMGIQGESGGLLMGGKGLKDVGLPLSKD